MRKLAVWTGTLVLLLALLAGGAYGFYWYQVKSFVDRIVEQGAPVANIEYGSIYADPRGEVGVDQVVVTLHRSNTRIPIKSIRLRSDDPLFFLNPSSRAEKGDWPNRLSFVVQQLQLSLASPLVRGLQQSAEQRRGEHPDTTGFRALGCGDVKQLDITAMRGMGYSTLALDLMGGVTFDHANRMITLDGSSDVSGVGHSQMRLQISVTSEDLRAANLMAANPRLRHLSVSATDAGYNARRDRFCAGKAGVDVKVYRQQRTELTKAYLAKRGIALPEPLLAAYFDSEKPRASVDWRMDPPGGIGAEVVAGLKAPQQLFDRLNLHLKVDDKPVPLDQLNLNELLAMAASGRPQPTSPPPAPKVAKPAPAPVKPKNSDTAQAQASQAPSQAASGAAHDLFRGMPQRAMIKTPEKSFKPTRIARLGAEIGKQVRVYTDLGRKMEGKLLSVGQGEMRIQSRVDNGVIQYPLDLKQVRSVEVYR